MKAKIKKFIKVNPTVYDLLLSIQYLFFLPRRKIKGANNQVLVSRGTKFKGSRIEIYGSNNRVEIGEFCDLNNFKIYIAGDNNTIVISSYVIFNKGGMVWVEDQYCTLHVGKNSTFEDVHLALTESGSKISIGEDCMFANDIDIRTGDSHSLLDYNSKKRINYAKDVFIGNHVWVGAHCSILKGVILANDVIVATRSLVNKTFTDEHVLIGGSPAKVLKNDITWKKERI